MFREHDVVKLKHDVPAMSQNTWPGTPSTPLKAGEVGTIVMVYTTNSVHYEYEVEFVDEKGMTYGLLTLQEKDIERI